MAQTAFVADREVSFAEHYGKNEASFSPVSWAAVIAGAFVSAALSLILLALGAGMGLSAISPWSGSGSAAAGRGAILWLIVVAIISSSIGGYLAGRLRTKWVNVHTEEVYFRDTAHGFLVWAVGVVMTGAFLASTAAFMVGAASRTAAEGRSVDPNTYFTDALFRTNPPTPIDASARDDAATILVNSIRQKDLSAWDRTYLSELVAAKTGMTGDDAEKRVTEVSDQMRLAADTTRKAAAHLLYWLFLALLIGAFSASLAATMGGRQRDRLRAV